MTQSFNRLSYSMIKIVPNIIKDRIKYNKKNIFIINRYYPTNISICLSRFYSIETKQSNEYNKYTNNVLNKEKHEVQLNPLNNFKNIKNNNNLNSKNHVFSLTDINYLSLLPLNDIIEQCSTLKVDFYKTFKDSWIYYISNNKLLNIKSLYEFYDIAIKSCNYEIASESFDKIINIYLNKKKSKNINDNENGNEIYNNNMEQMDEIIDLIEDILKEKSLVERDKYYNSLLACYKRIKKEPLPAQLFRKMRDLNVKLDPESYCIGIDINTYSKDFYYSDKLMKEMIENNYFITPVSCARLMYCGAIVNEIDKANEYYEIFLVLSGLKEINQNTMYLKQMESMDKENKSKNQIPIIAYRLVMNSLGILNESREAIDFYQLLNVKGIVNDKRILSTILNTCFLNQRYRRGRKIIQDAINNNLDIDAYSLNIAIRIYRALHDADGINNIINEMKKRSFALDPKNRFELTSGKMFQFLNHKKYKKIKSGNTENFDTPNVQTSNEKLENLEKNENISNVPIKA